MRAGQLREIHLEEVGAAERCLTREVSIGAHKQKAAFQGAVSAMGTKAGVGYVPGCRVLAVAVDRDRVHEAVPSREPIGGVACGRGVMVATGHDQQGVTAGAKES